MVDRAAVQQWIADEMPGQENWLVPTIVQLEIAKWLTREVGEEKADQVIAFTSLCHVAPLDTKIALAAADICARHKLATADAIVYATALSCDADLLTCDAHLKGLPQVLYVPKKI